MKANSLEDKVTKITTLLMAAKEINTIYFESRDEKINLIQKVIGKLKNELEDF